MLKALSLALLLVASPAIASNTKAPVKECVKADVFAKKLPPPVLRLTGEKTTDFLTRLGGLDVVGDKVPPGIEEIVIAKLASGLSMFGVFAKGCGIGVGVMATPKMDKLIAPKPVGEETL